MHHDPSPIRIRPRWWVVLLLSLVTACAPTMPTAKYYTLAKSSDTILQGTKETYSRIEKLEQRFDAVRATDKEPLTRDSFKALTDAQGNTLRKHLNFRKSALKVLVRYTQVLNNLAVDNFGDDVDKASMELSASLKSLGSTTAPDQDMVNKASGILATLANEVGHIIVEKKRREALMEVMDTAQPALEDLSRLIQNSNDKIKAAVDVMFSLILNHKNTIRPARDDARRIEFDTQVAKEIAEVVAISDSLQHLNTGIASIAVAHKAIRDDLNNKAGAKEALQQLIEEAQRVNEFYRSVK